MQEERPVAFIFEEKLSLLTLFQRIPGYNYENFSRFKPQIKAQSHKIIFQFRFQKHGISKNLFKTKDDIKTLQNQIDEKLRILPQQIFLENNNAEEGPLFANFLNNICNNDARNSKIFKKFVGQHSIINQVDEKNIESLYHGKFIQKSQTNYADRSIVTWFNTTSIFATDEIRYIAITNNSVYFMKDQFSNLTQSLPIADSISFDFPQFKDRTPTLKIKIKFAQKQIDVMAQDVYSFVILSYFASKAAALIKVNTNIYQSFASSREQSNIEHFIDGQGYFGSLLEDLRNAKSTVYITGWRISPQFYLKRNPLDKKNTLESVLKDLATRENPVKIYIVLFSVAQFLVPSKPENVKKIFKGYNNIQIQLHPIFQGKAQRPFFWSHHEKLVIIDKEIAYMGGFDLAFGRYDNSKHRLSDTEPQYTWPGADYCNQRIIDNKHPQKYEDPVEQVPRFQVPRLPWHDIGVRLKGLSMKSLQIHFVQYWNHIAQFKLMYQEIEMACTQSAPLDQDEILPEIDTKMFELAMSSFSEQEKFDINDKGFLQSIQKELKKQMQKYIINNSPNQKDAVDKLSVTQQPQIEHQSANECAPIYDKGSIKTQILRSSSNWGLGLKQTEKSICNAYKDLIKNATNYIYIENQFFMSKENGIADCIVEKIIQQVNNGNQAFKVIVMMPALPGISGHPSKSEGLFIMIHLTLDTINGMYKQLSKALKKQEKEVEKYIYFFSLRTHAKIKNNIKNKLIPVTEIVYIHSKLMIVDDKYAIIGSANINNRSLLGDRDSQLAVIVEDNTTQKTFVWPLLINLMDEHFKIKLSGNQSFTDQDWNEMKKISNDNHQKYKQIFGCYPDNSITDFGKFDLPRNLQEYEQKSPKIQGNAIPYQRKFLKDKRSMRWNAFYWAHFALSDQLYS